MTNEAGLEFEAEKPLRCKLCGGKGKHRHSYFDDQDAVIKYRTTRATPQPIDAWLPIETAPKNQTDIILRNDKGHVHKGWVLPDGRIYTFKNWDEGGNSPLLQLKNITHWMPFPKPPEGR